VRIFLRQWLPEAGAKIDVNAVPMTAGEISLQFSGVEGTNYEISVSRDLKRWIALASVEATAESMAIVDAANVERNNLFYRAESVDEIIQPVVEAVTASGSAGAYQFSTTIRSPETGWERYADWWEVVDETGKLLYRRVLTHPHEDEQPFTRSGGPVAIDADQVVWIRAHMNDGGYGENVYKGSVSAGFEAAKLSPVFGSEAAVMGNLPAE